MRSRFVAITLLSLLPLCAFSCSSWERQTFNTLATSKAVVDTAAADYENNGPKKDASKPSIPQTRCAYSIINDGRAAQTAAVNAMVVYEQLKAQKGNTSAQEATVTADLVALAPLIADIQALVSNPASKCPGSEVH